MCEHKDESICVKCGEPIWGDDDSVCGDCTGEPPIDPYDEEVEKKLCY